MPKILIVDDSLVMRITLKKYLESGGYEIAGEAGNGREALTLVEKLNPDLITLDLNMPFMDGMTALERLMKIDPSIKIIIVSAIGQERKIFEAMEMGAKNYIMKPFTLEKLIEVVKQTLEE